VFEFLLQERIDNENPRLRIALLEVGLIDEAYADKRQIQAAMNSKMTDFEDAVQASAADVAGLDFIVTRNQRDFHLSPVSAVLPEKLLELTYCAGVPAK